MLRLKFGAAVAALLLGGSAIAAPAPLADDAKLFGAREAAAQVALSPSGNKVVILVAGPGRTTLAKVFDLQTGAATTLVASNGNPESLSGANLPASYSSSAHTVATLVWMASSLGSAV